MRQQLRDQLQRAATRQGAESPLGMLSTAIFGTPTTTPAPVPQTPAETPAGTETPAPATEGAPATPAPAPAPAPARTPEQQRDDALRNALGGLFKTN